MSSVSSTGSLGTLSLTALGTGIDWQSIVSQLTTASEKELIPYNDEVSAYNTQISAWGTITSDLATLQTASQALEGSTSLDLYTANVSSNSTTSASTLLSASASTSANTGTYNVVINNIAQAEQVASGDFSSETSALNLSGTFLVNGQTVTVSSTDTLQDVQSEINALNAGSNATGVTASIIQDSSSSYRMVLSSDSTGASGFTLADGSGSTMLESLGFNQSGVTGSTANTTTSSTPITSSTLISAISGYTWTSGDSISITGTTHSGTSVSDTYSIGQNTTVGDLLNEIKTDFGNVTASVTSSGQIQVVDNTSGTSQLSLSLSPTVQDTSSSLSFGTFSTGTVTDVIQQGADASFTVDGMNITSSSNTDSNAISGVTLNLLGASPSTTLTVNVSHDTSGIESEINSMISAYNTVISDINTQEAYNTSTNTTGGPLFGDPTLQTLKAQLESTVLTQNGSGTYDSLASIGITIGSNGIMSMDSSSFETALSTDFQSVSSIFQDSGSTSSSLFQYQSNTSSTIAGTYNISLNSASSGTIDGQTATANGTSWSLSSSTSGADGLNVSYTGTSYPASATVTVSRGIASLLDSLVTSYTSSTSGIITSQTTGLNNSVTGLEQQMTSMQDNINQQMATLTTEFENMNTTVAQLDEMQSYLSAQLASI